MTPLCGLGRLGVDGHLGGIANLVVIAISIPIIIGVLFMIYHRNAAVGRSEFLILFFVSRASSNGALPRPTGAGG